MECYALFGGTFNPIHNAHIQLAEELSEYLDLAQVRLVPCYQAVHKNDVIESAHRWKMLKLACADKTQIIADDCEIKREQASYSIDTLRSLRSDLGSQVSILWLMGSDAFANFSSWKEWQDFLSYCHIGIIDRPLFALPVVGLEADLLTHVGFDSELDVQGKRDLIHQRAHGAIINLQLSQLEISSSEVRDRCRQQLSVETLVPKPVASYIRAQQLYQSTAGY